MSFADRNQPHDEDDLFSDSRMTFGEHIEDLRSHLMRALYGFGIALFLSFFIGKLAVEFIARPVEQQLQAFYDNRARKVEENLKGGDAELIQLNEPRDFQVSVPVRQLRDALGLKAEPEAPADQWVEMPMRFRPLDVANALRKAQEKFGKRPALTTLSIQEAFMVYFKVCIFCAIILSSPWVFYQLWSFVAAGLYPHEKRPVHVYLPFSIGLFLGGIALCEFFVLPKAIEVLLGFNEWLNLEPDLRLNEWLGFAILLPLVFGFSFQTPLVMLALHRIGIMTIDTFRQRRKLALFFLAIFAAFITPTPDAVTMLFMWVPLVGLYELGIFLCYLSPRPADLDIDVPDSEEMIEV
jgi:sec-independent protein translocase protein TatC